MTTINSPSEVAILMATYNGSKYLTAQIESIINQSFRNWTLYICDDGSTDNTPQIIDEFCKQDARIFQIIPHNKIQGAKFSFAYLLEVVNSRFYMFSDQDDEWKPEKIELSLNRIKELESIFPNKPIVVHTDLEVVDEKLNTINPSFWRMSKINPIILNNFNYIGICNCATGCTMIFNNEARHVSIPMPSGAEMHDWWVTLITAKYGRVDYINYATIKYRQHSSNVVGARNVNSKYFYHKIISLKKTIYGHIYQHKFLRLAGWGGWIKFYYFKILYFILRNIREIN